MSDHVDNFELDRSALVELHNDLVRELNDEKRKLVRAKSGQDPQDLENNVDVNYLQGKVIGFEIPINALHAFIVARADNAAGLLEPAEAAEPPAQP